MTVHLPLCRCMRMVSLMCYRWLTLMWSSGLIIVSCHGGTFQNTLEIIPDMEISIFNIHRLSLRNWMFCQTVFVSIWTPRTPRLWELPRVGLANLWILVIKIGSGAGKQLIFIGCVQKRHLLLELPSIITLQMSLRHQKNHLCLNLSGGRNCWNQRWDLHHCRFGTIGTHEMNWELGWAGSKKYGTSLKSRKLKMKGILRMHHWCRNRLLATWLGAFLAMIADRFKTVRW